MSKNIDGLPTPHFESKGVRSYIVGTVSLKSFSTKLAEAIITLLGYNTQRLSNVSIIKTTNFAPDDVIGGVPSTEYYITEITSGEVSRTLLDYDDFNGRASLYETLKYISKVTDKRDRVLFEGFLYQSLPAIIDGHLAYSETLLSKRCGSLSEQEELCGIAVQPHLHYQDDLVSMFEYFTSNTKLIPTINTTSVKESVIYPILTVEGHYAFYQSPECDVDSYTNSKTALYAPFSTGKIELSLHNPEHYVFELVDSACWLVGISKHIDGSLRSNSLWYIYDMFGRTEPVKGSISIITVDGAGQPCNRLSVVYGSKTYDYDIPAPLFK